MIKNYDFEAIMTSSKEELKDLVEHMVAESEGYELDCYILHKKLEFVVSEVLSKINAITQAEAFKGSSYKNVRLDIKETGVKYDYAACNHPQYLKLIEDIKEKDSSKKELEALLKNISKPQEWIDDESGEIYQVKPAIKTSKTSVVATIL